MITGLRELFASGSRSRAREFTLIELLVVVSIIAVLASMLLPALTAARNRARTTLCMGNERQFFPAIMAYSEEWGDWLPAACYDPRSRHSALWSAAVAHYAGFNYYTEWTHNLEAETGWKEPQWVGFSDKRRNSNLNYITHCPEDQFFNTWGTRMAVSYGWNGAPYAMGAGYGFNCCYTGSLASYQKSHGVIKIQEVAYPSGTVMAGDHNSGNGRYEYWYGNSYSPFNRSVNGFASYHNGGANVAWADGHVTTNKLYEMTAEDFDRRKQR